tara:strand:+ start:8224 stop:9057 length:834 start_codon:yes stop_codon:yes gene_type:complete
MQTDSDVDEAEITLEDNETEPSQDIDDSVQETDVDSQNIDETDSSPEEKVVFSEAQQQVLDKQIGKKVKSLREVERQNLRLQNRLNELENEVNKPIPVEVPPMPDAFSMTDADYKKAVENRDRAIVAKANSDAVAVAKQESARMAQAEQLRKQQEETNQLAEKYEKRATDLGITKEELREAGNNLYNSGLSDELAGFIINQENGPLISRYLGQNPLEADKVLQMRPSEAAVYIYTEVNTKLKSLAKSNINQAPDPIDRPAGSGKQKKQGGPKGATFE